jgi:hypothetical protein
LSILHRAACHSMAKKDKKKTTAHKERVAQKVHSH